MKLAGYIRLKRFLTRLGILPLRLWSILLVVNLTVLVLPLGSIFFFRIYENQLIRETEAELIAQSVFIAEIYKREIKARLKENPDGYGIALKVPQPDPTKAYYTPVIPKLDLVAGPIYDSRPDGIWSDKTADIIGTVVGGEIAELLRLAQKTTLSGIRVLDYNGIVVVGGNEEGQSFAHVREVERGLAGRYTSVIRQRISDEPPPPLTSISRGTGIRIFAVYPIINKDRLWGAVYLSRTPTSILKNLYAEKTKVILAGLIILALTLFIALITSWTIARPIYRLIERTRRISRGEQVNLQPDDVPGTREMALLSKGFFDMAGALEERSSYIKQFATHVSHEFKTPLTSIKGAAELLEEHADTMSAEKRSRFLRNIMDDAERMKQLVNRLLELARADNFMPAAETAMLPDVLETLQKSYNASDFKLLASCSTPLEVALSAEVLTMIFSNLIDNARQHGADEVRFDMVHKGAAVELSVTDNGAGISPANAARIFDPFFTTRRERGGTGLGLGIVRSLLENHRGAIRLDRDRSRTSFIVTLPATGPAR